MAKAGQNAFMRPLKPSRELAAITGEAPLPRTEVVRKIWNHIKKNNLQNPKNKREIMADDKLRPVFGKERVTMFELNKHLSRHLKLRNGSGSNVRFPPVPAISVGVRFRPIADVRGLRLLSTHCGHSTARSKQWRL